MRRAALAYSLPLMANGICLMLIKQLDQIVVANFFGLATLAVYSLGFNLAVTPTSPLQSISQKIGLPTLGNARESPETYRRTSALIVLGNDACSRPPMPCPPVLCSIMPFRPCTDASTASQPVLRLSPCSAHTCAFVAAGRRCCCCSEARPLSLAVGNMVGGIGALAGLMAGFVFRRLDGVMAGFALGDLASFVVYLFLVRRHVPLDRTLRHCGFLTFAMIGVAIALWAVPDLGTSSGLLIFWRARANLDRCA